MVLDYGKSNKAIQIIRKKNSKQGHTYRNACAYTYEHIYTQTQTYTHTHKQIQKYTHMTSLQPHAQTHTPKQR